MAGPLTHTVATRAIGAPVLAGLWMDAPSALPVRGPVEWTHGLPGALLAAALGRRWFVAWCVHVAIDSITHDCERRRGGHAMRKWGWLP